MSSLRSLDPARRGARAAAVALLGVTLAAGGVAQAATAEPAARAFVQETIDQVLAVLHDDAASVETKKARVEELAYQRFDFALISRLVLARNWKRFSETQRAEFTDAFKKHLSSTYRDTLDSFSNEQIEIVGSRIEQNGDVTVATVVTGPSTNAKVEYRLRDRDAGWRGIDVIIEGVSLVQNFRAQAQEIVSAEGPDGLIRKLRAKQIQMPRAQSS